MDLFHENYIYGSNEYILLISRGFIVKKLGLLVLIIAMLIASGEAIPLGHAMAAQGVQKEESTSYTLGYHHYQMTGSVPYEVASYVPFSNYDVDFVAGADGMFYYTDANTIMAYTQEGTLEWTYTFPRTDSSLRFISITPGGQIGVYECSAFEMVGEYGNKDNKFIYHPAKAFIFNKEGKITISYTLDASVATPTYSPRNASFDDQGNLYVDTDKGFGSFDTSGKLRWKNANISVLKQSEPMVAGYSNANYFSDIELTYITAKNDRVVAVNEWTGVAYGMGLDGKLLWQTPIEGERYSSHLLVTDDHEYLLNQRNVGGSLIRSMDGKKEIISDPENSAASSLIPGDGRGNYYFVDSAGIVQMNKHGVKNWTYKLGITFGDEPLVADSFGNVYFSDDDGSIYSLNRDGKLRFKFHYIDGYSTSDIYMKANGDLLVMDYGIITLRPTNKQLADMQSGNPMAEQEGPALTDNQAGTVDAACDPFASDNPYAKNTEIRIFMDCQEVDIDPKPLMNNGSVLVPLRDIFERLGASVSWDQGLQTIQAQKGSTKVYLQIGNKTAYSNNQKVQLNAAPQLVNGSTFVPLRFVSEVFNCKVQWNKEKLTVFIVTTS
ncbi:stalk domain-containing protein [Paenibacillus sp. MMS18-CY102]|uniref:stalk domain-containing protein n=1 Tax=Paenibacillus sp. MMS18-CY102 TaxID=2682849 RepID=UPI0013661277|nr:stalk domain-containing protein [Paenibacillus sp. MMS18-CY102]MWC30331.1 hypothetical protein [Paenibacillus sp. MMS18-CY102]